MIDILSLKNCNPEPSPTTPWCARRWFWFAVFVACRPWNDQKIGRNASWRWRAFPLQIRTWHFAFHVWHCWAWNRLHHQCIGGSPILACTSPHACFQKIGSIFKRQYRHWCQALKEAIWYTTIPASVVGRWLGCLSQHSQLTYWVASHLLWKLP